MIRTLIFGAGAVGSLIGGLLANAGHPVFFVGRRSNVDGIRSQGISITGLWGNHKVAPQPAYETIQDIPEAERVFDQIFICVKAFDTPAAIEACKPVVGDSTIVISMQNGYGNCQIIADAIGQERTLGGRFITGVELTAPGELNVTVHFDAIRLGHYWREFPLPHLQSFAMTLYEAGVPCEATEELEQFIWAKIMYNAALNPLGALLGVTYGALADNPNTRAMMDDVLDEAFAVTAAHGIPQFWTSADEYRQAFYDKMVPATAAHFPSMLRDLEKGRRTEVDALNGAICQLGAEKNIKTPVNQTITRLLRAREQRPS
ncbi:MAG: 2-dehydropantoate 2-reductase [Candidatus Hinthialibacter antarcticus]|nr:2-dehydropantoate 2-reductase [Candidatus Hinthialibacter antarcticus]